MRREKKQHRKGKGMEGKGKRGGGEGRGGEGREGKGREGKGREGKENKDLRGCWEPSAPVPINSFLSSSTSFTWDI
jgi:hypothetical protein